MDLPEVTTHTPKWFEHRMIAIGNIIARLSDEEKEDLEKEVKRISEEGYDEEDRRR